jgi:glycosyltransferase involved in cell wall biosynthesis
MKIALVHEWLLNVSGSEKVLLEMKKIYPKAPIYTSVYNPERTEPFADFEIRTSFLQHLPLARSKREILIPFAPLAFEQFDLGGFEVVLSNCHAAAKGVITKPDTIHICYCNTPTRYLWEPDVDPRARGGKLSWLRNRTAHNMRVWDRLAADRVDYFIANSNYVASRIKKYYKRDSIVIYPPVDINRFDLAKSAEIKDYFLFVSRLIPYKKCDLVVAAFNDLGLPLKIIGEGPEKKRLQKMAKNNIEFLGYVSDLEQKKYYEEARGFIFPAEEDFGIVPVEAMAAGRPVIAYCIGGASETVVPGQTGVLFKEQTTQCLIDAVRNFKENDYDPKKIRKQAEKFSAERFRKELKETVEKITG